MKKLLSQRICCAALFLLPVLCLNIAQASTLIDGLYYDLNTSSRTATVTYETIGTDNYASLPASVKIPETVTCDGITFTVTKVADQAFANCTSLEEISIPGTVTEIGTTCTSESYLPFYKCTSLIKVKFEDGVQSISLGVFFSTSEPNSSYCSKGLFAYCPLQEVYIGRNIFYVNYDSYFSFEKYPEYYGYSAFYNQPMLAKVTFSSTVTEIPAYLFYKNVAMTLTDLPKVKTIGKSAFEGCSKLTTLNFGQDLMTVDDRAFYNCTNVTKLTFPDAITTIGDEAFYNCTALRKLDLGQNLLIIGPSAFENDKALEGIEIPSTLYGLGVASFKNCTSLPYVEVKSISSVGKEAFMGCTGLKWISLSDKTTSLGENSFAGCSNIAYVKSYATTAPEGLVNFPSEVVANGTLFVPEGYEDDYTYSATWEDWMNIKPLTENVLVSSITLSQTEANMKATETLPLRATVGSEKAVNKSLIWKSSNESIATVSEEGVITANAVGHVTITAIAADGSGVKATCDITVDPTLAESISLDQPSLTLKKKRTANLVATISPVTTTNKSLTWTSDNPEIATVDNEGNVKTLTAGETTIKVSANDGSGITAECHLTVTAPKAGDSNDDDEVNVVDAVNTVNYILNKVVGTFEFEAADVNKDNHISVSDVTGTTAIILQQPLQAKESIAMAKDMNVSDKNENYIVYSQPSKNAIDVALDVNSNYTAMQTDIVMTENVDDINLKLDDAIASTHLLTSSKLNAHTLRVVVYSLSNSTFMDGRAIFTLTSKKGVNPADVQFENAVASDAEAKGYGLDAQFDQTTSIASVVGSGKNVEVVADGIVVSGEKGMLVSIYNTAGMLVQSQRLATETMTINLPAGVYLVKLNQQVVKVTVK